LLLNTVLLLLQRLSGDAAAAASSDPNTATGACDGTDKALADLCRVPGGICHAFCVPQEGATVAAACAYRGTYINDLVSFRDPAEAAFASQGNVSVAKIYRFTTPALAGFPSNDCDMDNAIGDMAETFLGSRPAAAADTANANTNTTAANFTATVTRRKHISFKLESTHAWNCPYATMAAELCATLLVPTGFDTDSAKNKMGEAIVMEKRFGGVDGSAVRDSVLLYNPESQTEQTLMYQLFAQNASVSKLNFGDTSQVPAVCISSDCVARDFTAGSFRFTAGTAFPKGAFQNITKANAVRLEFHVALENGAQSDNDAAVVAKQDNSMIWLESNRTQFCLDFDTSFLYGAYDRNVRVFEKELRVGTARVSLADVATVSASIAVFVDLLLDDEVKNFCTGTDCMLLYGQVLTVADRPVKPSASVAAVIMGGVALISSIIGLLRQSHRRG
jgi:hypothetical protein